MGKTRDLGEIITNAVIITTNQSINGIKKFINNVESTSTITGTVIVEGGVGISGSIFAGNLISALGGTSTQWNEAYSWGNPSGVYVPLSQKGAINGVATLDGSGKLLTSQLPSITISDTFVVASQAAMLAIVGETGDVAVRSDLNKSYILKGTNPTVLGDWQELLTPTSAVTSVFGRNGAVSALANDYNADQILETVNRVFITPTQKTNYNTAFTNSHVHSNISALNLVSGTNTGDQTTITGNSGTATTLQTARTLWGQSFNGSANLTGGLTIASGAGVRSIQTSDTNNSISLDSHSNHTWLRNVIGSWTFVGGSISDDWTNTLALNLPTAGTVANNVWAELGQRQSNAADGRYKGIRIVKYAGSTILDGELKAGLVNFTDKLLIGSGAFLNNSYFRVGQSIAGHLQANVNNTNSGTTASSDWVATNNIGNDTSNFINFGINSSTNSDATWTMAGANDGYLFINGGHLAIGTATASKDIKLFSGGTLAANEKARMFGATGNFSFGNIVDSGFKIDVTGTARISGVTTLSNLVGTGTRFITVSSTGVLSAGANPTTIAGYGITDASPSSHNHTLDALSNTTITSNTTGEILKWNGTAWINNTLAEAGIQPAGSYLTGTKVDSFNTRTGVVTLTSADVITALGFTPIQGNYLPIAGGTLTGSRPITLDSTAGSISFKGAVGGWAIGNFFNGSSGTLLGGFGVLGSSDTLTHFFVGDYNTPLLKILPTGATTILGSLDINVANINTGIQNILRIGENASQSSNYGLVLKGNTSTGVFTIYGVNATVETATPILALNRSSGFVGMGIAAPTERLDIVGNARISGSTTSGSFSGAGTGLTGTAAGLSIGGTATSSIKFRSWNNLNYYIDHSWDNTGWNLYAKNDAADEQANIHLVNINGKSGNTLQVGGIPSNRVMMKRRTRISSIDGTSMNTSITSPEMGFTYGGSGEPAGSYIAFGGLNGDIDYSCQLATSYAAGGNQFNIRTHNGDSGIWNPWRNIITDGNYSSYALAVTGGLMSGNIGRTSHASGFQVGSYNNVGPNDSKTNPIYVIGDNYRPTDTSLANMYGIGYAYDTLWGSNKGAGWGLYVTEAGNVNNTLTSGGIWTQGKVQASATGGFSCSNYTPNGRSAIYYLGDAPGYGLSYFQGTAGITSGVDTIGIHFGTANAASSQFTFQQNGVFRASNDIIAFASSDRRLKDNIKPIKNALDKISKIGGYEFDWNENQNVHTGHDIGVIAQEIEAVLPEIVTTRDNGYKAVKYEKLVALLLEAVKEQQSQINELRELINNKN